MILQIIMYYPPKKVHPYIWIGSEQTAVSSDFIQDNNIKLIVNCTREVPSYFAESIETVRIPLDDHPASAPIMYGAARDVTRRMKEYIDKGSTVLVHCAAGISRSSSIVACYMILHEGYTMQTAMDAIQTKKPETFKPRVVFSSVLQRLEDEQRFVARC